jgi:hypothetical protein
MSCKKEKNEEPYKVVITDNIKHLPQERTKHLKNSAPAGAPKATTRSCNSCLIRRNTTTVGRYTPWKILLFLSFHRFHTVYI